MGLTTSTNFSANTTTVFNGGGSGRNSYDEHYTASSGGGASDIRLLKDDLYHRVIVAGGGGGTGFYEKFYKGGNGGGEEGGNGEKYVDSPTAIQGIGANQTSGNSLGIGGSRTDYDGCGGGGGWYGGHDARSYNGGGGGGSGFVYTKCNTNIATAGQLVLNDIYYLEDASTTQSNHTSDGRVLITVFSIEILPCTCQIRNPIPMIYYMIILFNK